MLAVVLDDEGTIVCERKAPRPRGPKATVDEIVALLSQLAADGGRSIDALGIGIAGAIGSDGVVKISPNLPELVEFRLRDLLAERIDIPVMVDNDATAATWAEHQVGAGQDVDHLLYAALGTGVGTGFVLNGQIYRGAHGYAGEAGHMVIDRNGRQHISGAKGPWEMYASGNGLGALGREWAKAGQFEAGIEIAGSAAQVQGEHVSTAIAKGDPAALELLDEFANNVAVGLTNLIYVLDPAMIVLGGGLVDIGEPLRCRVQERVDATTVGGALRGRVPVRLAELGARSAALGAAMLARGLGAS